MPATTGRHSVPADGGMSPRGPDESVRAMTQRRQEQTWSESDPESGVAEEISAVGFGVREALTGERTAATCAS